jgi:hypothetical protein
MSGLAPWLVVGGAAAMIVCVGITLATVPRALRRRRAPVPGATSARSALAQAADSGADDDTLMPLLVAAAIDAARADAAVVTFVRAGDRRRSYSANLDVREARSVVDALVGEGPGPLPAGLVTPIERPSLTGALGVYWQDEAERDVQRTDLEELVALAFRPLPGVESVVRPAAEEDTERWSRLADFNGTLEAAPLLRKIVGTALADCGADAAAARIGTPEVEPFTEVRAFAEHELQWAETVLDSNPLMPSITRYLARSDADIAASEPSIATAIVVPLRDTDGNAAGSLVAVWRVDLADEGDARLAELEQLADDARAALGNALRFQRLQSIAAGTAQATARPATTPVVTGPMRLSVGGAEEWKFRTPAPERSDDA